jgi:PAS domain S-box-containing protein
MDETWQPQSEARFRALFEQSPTSTMIYGADGHLLRVNAAFSRLWGLTLEDLQPDYCIFADPQLQARGVMPLVERAFAGEAIWLPPFAYDALPLAADGQKRWAEAFLYPITTADGAVCEVVLTHYDVTERMLAAEALQRAEALARSQVEALTRTTRHLAEAPNLDPLLGHVLAEIIQQVDATLGYMFVYDTTTDTFALHTLVRDGQASSSPSPDDPPFFAGPFAADLMPQLDLLRSSRQVELISYAELQHYWPEAALWQASYGPGEIAVYPLLAGDQLVGIMTLTFRQSARLSAMALQLIQTLGQQAALAIQFTRLANDARQLAVLEERTRLAREIHDTLAQGFTGVIVQLQAAAEIAAANPAAQQAHIALAIDLAKNSLAEARRSVRALRTPALHNTDLSGALLRVLRQQTAHTGISATFASVGTPLPLADDVEGQIVRIGQEAITNVVRHAQATNLDVTLHFSAAQVRLDVIDNGVGFATDSIADDRYGVLGMHERAQQIGATLRIVSSAEQGTAVHLAVPHERSAHT